MIAPFQAAIGGSGWMTCKLTADDKSFEWQASYITDAVYDLLTATDASLRGHASEVVFVEEPGCVILSLVPRGDDRLEALARSSPNWPMKRGAVGGPVATFDLGCRTFAASVLTAFQQILVTDPPEEYKRKWGHEYPHHRVKALQIALSKGR